MTPADHIPDVLRTLHAHLVTAAIAAEVHAVEVEQRRAVCPVDGCLVLVGEDCPACRVRVLTGPCMRCGTQVIQGRRCKECARMKRQAKKAQGCERCTRLRSELGLYRTELAWAKKRFIRAQDDESHAALVRAKNHVKDAEAALNAHTAGEHGAAA